MAQKTRSKRDRSRTVKRVFISSTVYDLRSERALVRQLLDSYNAATGIRFECMASDHPDFPISPKERATRHSFDVCIDSVRKCDYFVLLIRRRYGAPIIQHKGDLISITHREFREAHRLKIPRFVLIDSRTWDAKHAFDSGRPQSFVAPDHIKVFDLIDETRTLTRGNWIDFFTSQSGIRTTINTFLAQYDDSTFVSDITVPHGSLVETGDRFIKTWEIANNGLTVWSNRFLREENPVPGGLVPTTPLIPIPRTRPGERVRLSVEFTAPSLPATCESYWKMVDGKGNYCFPHKFGLNCCVKAV